MRGLLRKASFLRSPGRIAAVVALGLVALLNAAPATSEDRRAANESAALPPGPGAIPDLDAALPPDITLTRKVRKGDTLALMLTRAGADANDARVAIAALQKVHNVRGLVIGDDVTVTFERLERYRTGRLLSIALPAGTDYTVRADRIDEDSFKAAKIKRNLSTDLVRASGTINSSFYLSGANAGLSAQMMAELVKLFSYDIDFQRDLQTGDKFEVLYQRVTSADGAFVRRGDIAYAALTLSGVRHAVYAFRAPGSNTVEYFDAKGASVRKALLRTPLDAARISSGFGNRMHPILGYTRMHRGVDFAAPAGTPIFAAGNGKVEEAGRKGGYGIYVRVKHDGQFETAYGHMRMLGKGIRPGAPVFQGQIIGYVGATGEATGPHLHYELIQKGNQVNPLGVKFAGGRVLNGTELKAFAAARTEIDRALVANVLPTKIGQK